MKATALFGALCLVLLLPACGDDAGTGSDTDLPDTQSGRPDLGPSDPDTASDDDVATDAAADDTGTDVAIADGSSDADLDAADTSGSADVNDASDGSASDTETEDVPVVEPCPEVVPAYTGVLVEDTDGGTFDVGDTVRITVGLLHDSPVSAPLWLGLEHENLTPDASSATIGGVPIVPEVTGDRWTISQPDGAVAELQYTATVDSADGLVAVFASLRQTEIGCEVPRARSGAFFQITGGESKTPVCIDMERYRSMQVAPFVAKQNTAEYARLNGIRADLRAEGFIFCPQSPTIVHEAEFCLQRDPDQNISFAGSYLADGFWEVDDFVLIETDDGTTLRDAFTTQNHTGHPNRFYCNATSTQLCTTDCTAQLVEVDSGSAVRILANVTAEGPTARQHLDGAVSINSLLPTNGAATTVRITALDTGVEGTLTPALYLVSDAP
jgi:hypothetical protein